LKKGKSKGKGKPGRKRGYRKEKEKSLLLPGEAGILSRFGYLLPRGLSSRVRITISPQEISLSEFVTGLIKEGGISLYRRERKRFR
jgi:hypothetical protein